MKQKIVLFTFVLFAVCFSVITYAQNPGQLLIPIADDSKNIVYLCKGEIINKVYVPIFMRNLQSDTIPDLFVDSVEFDGDTSKFGNFPKWVRINIPYWLTYFAVSYHSNTLSDDTLLIKGFYGHYVAMGKIIMHTRASPAVALYGYENLMVDYGGGYGFGISNKTLATDTLHDYIGPVNVSSTPVYRSLNKKVAIQSCGETDIDSIYTVGDFSEIQFLNLPSTPLRLKEGDSLSIQFTLIPQHIGESQHYLVFHTTSGQYLVWSFEYDVYPPLAVKNILNDDLSIYPNPTRGVLNLHNAPANLRRVIIMNTLGYTVSELTNSGTPDFTIDLSKLPSGTYFARFESENEVITRKIIKE